MLRVVATGRTSVTNSGLAHRAGGIGQIGAGWVRTPLACHTAAAAALDAAPDEP